MTRRSLLQLLAGAWPVFALTRQAPAESGPAITASKGVQHSTTYFPSGITIKTIYGDDLRALRSSGVTIPILYR